MSIRTVDYQSANAGRDYVRSLPETGFAVLRNHPVPRETLDSIYRGWARFFNSDEKLEFMHDPENRDGTQQGFYPVEVSETAVGHTVKDIKEYFHVVPGCRVPAALEAEIFAYRQLTFEMGEQLCNWLQDHSPPAITTRISEPFNEILSSRESLMRVLHYPPLTGGEKPGAERAAAHEDINVLTILPVAEQPGLQVKDKTGNWVDVASIRGELVVNSGDMLKEMTDGYYPSTTHRVLNPSRHENIENVSRISVPFFLTARAEVGLAERDTSGSDLQERLCLSTR